MIWGGRRFDTFCIFQSSAYLDQSTEFFFKSGIFHDGKKSFHHVAVEKKSFWKACQQRVQGIKVSTVRRRTDIQRSPWPNHAHNSDQKNGPIEMELLKLDPKRKILRTTEMDLDVSSFLVYCYRKRIENQTMKNRAFVLPLSPSCPPQDLEGPFIKEAPPKTFPKGSFKHGPEGFLQNIRLMQPIFLNLKSRSEPENNSAYFTSF